MSTSECGVCDVMRSEEWEEETTWKCCANCGHLVASGECEMGLALCDIDKDWIPEIGRKMTGDATND